MKTFPYLILLMSFLVSMSSHGQDCRNFEKKCPSPPKDYKISSLSKSFSLRKKQIIHVKLTLFSNRLYFFSVDGKKNLGVIHFRIFEDNEERRIIYDNASNGFDKTKILNIQSTVNLVIEVSAPSYFKDRVRECSGLLVAYKAL
nr:hypothetical protein [uncultured Carboxylicivirga sp.]